jgi:hypothetical protein
VARVVAEQVSLLQVSVSINTAEESASVSSNNNSSPPPLDQSRSTQRPQVKKFARLNKVGRISFHCGNMFIIPVKSLESKLWIRIQGQESIFAFLIFFSIEFFN